MLENGTSIRHNHVIFTIMRNQYKFGLSYTTDLEGCCLNYTLLRQSFHLLGPAVLRTTYFSK
jgi:hypothetical protein